MFNRIGRFDTLVRQVTGLFESNLFSRIDSEQTSKGKNDTEATPPKIIKISANPLLNLANRILSTKEKESITIDGQKYCFFVTYEDNQERTETKQCIDRDIEPRIKFLDIELVSASEGQSPINNADKIAESILRNTKGKPTIVINGKSYLISNSELTNTTTLANLKEGAQETITLQKDKNNKPLRLEIKAEGSTKVFDFSRDTVIRLRAQVVSDGLIPLSIISKGPNGLISYGFKGALRLDILKKDQTRETYNLSPNDVSYGGTSYSGVYRIQFTNK